MDLIFFGIQGSGKGTQAKKLAAEFGYDIFEAGGELRKIAASGSELGNLVKTYVDAGNLVPHEIIMQVVKEAILSRPKDQKILFDGIPRDTNQMKDFDDIMQSAVRDFVVIYFDLDRQTAIERLKGRASIEGRADDADEQAVLRRFQIFEEKTKPVFDEYKKQGKVKAEIKADRSVEEIYEELKKVVS